MVLANPTGTAANPPSAAAPGEGAAQSQDGWSTADSAALYGIDRWGEPYFSVGARGHVIVQPRGERGGSLLSRLETRVRRLAWTEGEPKRELPRRGLQRARHAIAHTRVLFDGSARGDARRDKGACWNWHGVPRRATALLQTRTTLGPIGHSPKGREAAAM